MISFTRYRSDRGGWSFYVAPRSRLAVGLARFGETWRLAMPGRRYCLTLFGKHWYFGRSYL